MTQYDVGIKYEVDAAAIKQARKEINNTNKELDNSKKKAKDVGDSGKAGFGKMKVAAAAAAAAIVVVGTAALKAAAITRAEFAKINQINDIALFTGASLQGLADLEARSKLVGISVDQLTGVLIRQQEKLQEGNVIFDQLGLSLDRLNLVDPTQAFQEIINAINDTDDAALKARGITQLLGEGSVGALKLAGDLGTVEEQLNRLRASGAILSEQDLEKAARMDEITNEINTSWDTIRRNVAITFGPKVLGVMEEAAEIVARITDEPKSDVATRMARDATQALRDARAERDAGGDVSDELINALEDEARALGKVAAMYLDIADKARNVRDVTEELGQLSVNPLSNIRNSVELTFGRGRIARNELDVERSVSEPFRLEAEEEVNAARERRLEIQQKEYEAELELAVATQRTKDTLVETVEVQKEINNVSTTGTLLPWFEKIHETIEMINEEYNKFTVASQRAELNAMLERELEIGREIANGQITSSDQLSRRLELERELLDIREQFPDLAEEEVAARAKGILIAREANEELLKEMDDYRDFIDGLSRSFGNILGDSIIDSLESGRLEFDSFFSDIGKMLIRSGIQELIGQIFSPQQGGSGGGGSIFQLLLTGIISAFAGGSSGDGGGSGGGGASVGAGMRGGLAKGGVVNSTEMYGGYQISEQSPEAIMPLTRDSQGRLGVSASGGGSGGVTYNFSNVINVTGSDQPQETADKTAAALNQLIDRKIKAQMIDQRRAGNMLNTIPNRY